MLKNMAVAGLVAFSASATAQYATQSGTGEVWKNPYGLCWHSAFWTPDQAIDGCDAVARPAPAPVPVATPAPQPSYEKVTLSADVLFDFGKSTLKDAGKAKLDELADRL